MSKLYSVVASTLGVAVKEISDASSPDTIPSWDSFNGLRLVDALEKEFKVNFTMDEVLDVKTVADIRRHLRSHGIEDQHAS